MRNTILILLVIFYSHNSYAQYDGFFKSIIKKSDVFKPLDGEFIVREFKHITVNGKKEKINCSYRFNNKLIQLEYFYPKSEKDNSCSYFVIKGVRINLKGHFENDFACDLDITSFRVYQGRFKGKNYILLTSINSGSGGSTTSVICNLFDITNKKSIRYYPLWSKYGGASCFGDFNRDGILDFLKIRYFKGNRDSLKMSLMSLQNNVFRSFQDEKQFIILKLNDDNFKIIERKWFN